MSYFWYRIKKFVKDWIYPAYHLRNLLFNRYDLVKLPGLSKCEYADVVERLFLANMVLLRDFVDKERPLKDVCWYGADNISGPRWHSADHPQFPAPEYEGCYIMDLILEIHHWYTTTYPALVKTSSAHLTEWDRLREEFPDKSAAALKRHDELEQRIFDETQKYLHLIAELRPYLWT